MLSERHKKHLRRLGHALSPLVTLGQAGLTDAVCVELERALSDHELVKVRIRAAQRDERDATLAKLATRSGSELVQRIGNVALLYKPDSELPRIVLPGNDQT